MAICRDSPCTMEISRDTPRYFSTLQLPRFLYRLARNGRFILFDTLHEFLTERNRAKISKHEKPETDGSFGRWKFNNERIILFYSLPSQANRSHSLFFFFFFSLLQLKRPMSQSLFLITRVSLKLTSVSHLNRNIHLIVRVRLFLFIIVV